MSSSPCPCFFLIPLALFLLNSCASTRPAYDATAAFPIPSEIRDNVDFWRKVYGEWGRDQVAFHDDAYLGVIYEVLKLPDQAYTPEQRRLVQAKAADYRRRLRALEHKVAAGISLNAEEQRLYDQLVAKGGKQAVFGAADRLRIQRGVREKFRRGLEISGRYDSIFREIFRARGLPEDLAYLPHVESSFQAHARSSVGAAGIWQFMPGTGRIYDLRIDSALDERWDPILAAEGAARYLDAAYRKLGSWPLAITSYNHGQGGMARAKRLHGQDIGQIVKHYRGPYFGFDSRNFYAQFLAAREVASHADRYFPEGIVYEPPLQYDRIVLHHSLPATRLARHYRVSLDRLQQLNPAWRPAIARGNAWLPAGATVWLPSGTTQRISVQPEPLPARIAVQAKPKPVQLARAGQSARKSRPKQSAARVARAKPKPVNQTRAKKPKTHVVKPHETLYRVALQYDISVEKLRKLNRMKPNDNKIRVGQRLRVSG